MNISIHRIKSIRVVKTKKFNSDKVFYSTEIIIKNDKDRFFINLFSDDKEKLKIHNEVL